MDTAKFFSDFLIVMVATAAVVAPRALEAYLAVREQDKTEQTWE